MLQFYGLGRYTGADRGSCGLTESNGGIFGIASPGGCFQQISKPGQMHGWDVGCTCKFRKQRINGCHMESWNKTFQLRKKDCYETGKRRFQLCPLFYLIKTVVVNGKCLKQGITIWISDKTIILVLGCINSCVYYYCNYPMKMYLILFGTHGYSLWLQPCSK